MRRYEALGVSLHTQPPGGRHPQPSCLACSSSAALTGTQLGRTALSWWGKLERIGDGHVGIFLSLPWLQVASPVPGFIGFAVGRTNFSDPLKRFLEDPKEESAAIEAIARNYKGCVDTWQAAR